MKKFLTLSAIFFFACLTMTQAQFILGGNIGFSSQKQVYDFDGDESEIKLTNLTLIPRFGFAFGDFWAGLDVGISSLKAEEEEFDYEFKSSVTTVSPFIRYIKKPTENFGVWVEGQAGFSFGKSEEDGDDLAKYAGINIGLRPGVIFFINDMLSFEASFGRLGFSQTTVEDAEDSDYKVKTSEVGFSANNNGVDLAPLFYFENEEPQFLKFNSGFMFGVNLMFGGTSSSAGN
ncbi:MAG: hypothetical protein IPH31_20680 [Lewinellaceae bacterium]|nr:hypothetical protein [Lewinellaceae bacterium]